MHSNIFFRYGGLIFAGLLCVGAAQKPPAPDAHSAAPVVGWYNGDWQPGLPGYSNWYLNGYEFSRVYDDFVVPTGGWRIVGVFSDNRMEFDGVSKAAWEIRRDMAPGEGGKRVASGVSHATQTVIAGEGPFSGESLIGYRIQVNGLHVRLEPGRYWLSVAPVGKRGYSYASSTLGKNAIGEPAGNDGMAVVHIISGSGSRFDDAETVSSPGKLGQARDYSMGVIIEAAPGDSVR